MNRQSTYVPLLVLTAVAILIISACGGGSDSSAEESAPGGSEAVPAISVRTVDGVGEVLVDAEGAALYATDQEAAGMVLCTDACAAIWEPLTVSGKPTASDGLAAGLGVMNRPDGSKQVTFQGRMLYRFVEDPRPGIVTGNGFTDDFRGQVFTWHVATPGGVSTTSANSSSPSDGYSF